MGGDKFNCSRCRIGHYCDDGGDMPGSLGPAPYELFAIENVISTRTCLLPMVSPLSLHLLKLYGHYEDGHLYRAGGLNDQPAAYLEAMEIIGITIKRIQADNQRK